MMTLTQFEMHCQRVFAERLPGIRDASEADAQKLLTDLFNELEAVAVAGGVEVCARGAYLLVLAWFDMSLEEQADALGVEASYFTEESRRGHEEEAFMYLHERRCGLPARQFITLH